MKANVYSIDGKQEGSVDLPSQFNESYRPDVIRRAFHSYMTEFYQPKGNDPLAGLKTSAEYFGRRHAWRQTINTGRSRLPREKLPGGRLGQVRIVPHAIKGRRAHPPKPQKVLLEKINLKEKNLAIRSSIAATTDALKVKARGHVAPNTLPIVVDDSFEALKRVKDALKTLHSLGIDGDLTRAKENRKKRSGRARMRKSGYVVPKSVLIVAGDDKGVWKAVRNLPGVDYANVKDLNVELLAPGGVAGRLVIWTKSAIEKMKAENLYY
ncbi:50S ribosomal protein L4 [Candidatus Micrarchaeota archaeon]|nr:50S ribosomal protein L4 [Candidatus Micrarchaeota archaeon]